jgi:tetratricopeptide (TPR) repeat protein
MMSQLLDARYQIVQLLGTNSVEESYLAEDTNNLDAEYCVIKKLKFINPSEQTISNARQLFISEADKLRQVAQSPSQIQKLIAYFEADKEFYLVQEYVVGNSLAEEIFIGKPIHQNRVIHILLDVLETLIFAHSRGITHGNIKLTNIIRRNLDSKLVLTDFHGAKQVIVRNFKTPEYVPMEQLHGHCQLNSDIYALGIIAIAALTGLPVHQIAGTDSPKNSLTGEIVWRKYSKQVSPKLVQIINKMVRLNYRHRYQTAFSLLSDLRKLKNPQYQYQAENLQKIKFIIAAGLASSLVAGIFAWMQVYPGDIDHAKIFYEQGLINYQQTKYKDAIQKFSKAIQVNPNFAQAYNQRGNAYYRLHNYEKSQADSSEAIRLNPRDVNAYYDRGFSLYTLGNYNGAIADYNQAIQLNPNSANFYYARGLARSKIKEKQAAIEDLNKALAINPQYAEAYLERGTIYRRQGLKLQAVKDLDRAVELQPENPEFYYQRGLANYKLNQKFAARKDFTKVLELSPNHIQAYLSRADVYSDLTDPQKAYADLNQALLLDPKYADTYIHWGNFRMKQNDQNGAIDEFNKALALEPKNPSAYNFRGNAFLEKGDHKNAINDYSQAIEIKPDYALAYYNRGLVRTDLGKVPAAIEDLEKAAQFFQDRGEENSYNDAMEKLKAIQPGR